MNYNGEECYGVIYTITHKESGKKYVGQTVNIGKRWTEYRRLGCKKQIKLYNALRKYGIKAFAFEVVYPAYDKEQLDWLEKWFIEEGHTVAKGYNCREGGVSRWKATDETRGKLSFAARERYKNPEAREKVSITMRKYCENPEVRKKRSLAEQKRCESLEVRKKMSASSQKHWRDPSARERLRSAVIKRYEDPLAREKMGLVQRKRYENSNDRERVSIANRKRWADPKAREKMRAIMRERCKNPEERKLRSINVKEVWRKRKLAAIQKTREKEKYETVRLAEAPH